MHECMYVCIDNDGDCGQIEVLRKVISIDAGSDYSGDILAYVETGKVVRC